MAYNPLCCISLNFCVASTRLAWTTPRTPIVGDTCQLTTQSKHGAEELHGGGVEVVAFGAALVVAAGGGVSAVCEGQLPAISA